MVPPHFQRLVIYGVGLLGGSLGLALKQRGMTSRVVGLGRSMPRLERALQLGAIDECQTEPAQALAGADALILATPPRQIRECLVELAPLIASGAFVTDVGSVKARIVEEAERILSPKVLFIGSHPMAGSEKTGVEYSREDFYEKSACLLTPTGQTRPEALALATSFWQALGSRIVIATPERHDNLLAGISHLPHLTAAALMQTLGRGLASPEELATIAGGGLRDTTRIADSDPELWKQIFAENAPALLKALDAYLAVLQSWRAALDVPETDLEKLADFYAEGRNARQSLQSSAPNSE